MNRIKRIRFLSIFIFLLPFAAINICLILVTHYPEFFSRQEDTLNPFFPYIDGEASISRVARPYPSWLVFKPAMLLTSLLLVMYWFNTKWVIYSFDKNHRHIKKIIFFGISSAILLAVHSIFLGIKFEYDLYKLFRRVVLLSFIIFEVIAQTFLVLTLIELKSKINSYINKKFLKLKLILVYTLIIVALFSIVLISLPGNKAIKHILEWNYFLGVISFYILTFFMWKNKKLY